MTIRDNVKKVQRLIYKDLGEGDLAFTNEVQTRAMQAILKGFGDNEECEAYMQFFADTPEQLDRLMGRDGTTGPDHEGKDRIRAYLMAAGTCGPETVQHLDKIVFEDLD